MVKFYRKLFTIMFVSFLVVGLLPQTLIVNEVRVYASPSVDKWDGKEIDLKWYEGKKSDYYFNISTKEELVGLAYLVNDNGGAPEPFYGRTITLMSDIDLNGIEWTPIGTVTNPFRGDFRGNNKTIKNLTISNNDLDYVGLFGKVGDSVCNYRNGSVSNLMLSNVSVLGNNYVGSLVGFLGKCTSVQNIHILSGSITGNDIVGGLVGWNSASLLNDDIYGGINTSSSRLTVNGQNGINDSSFGAGVGGLVGVNKGLIKNSFSTSTTIGYENYIGGFVGKNDGQIENSYATGSVSGNDDNTGGLVGENDGQIEKSYATGFVYENSTLITGVDKLIGRGDTSTINSSFYNSSGTGFNFSDLSSTWSITDYDIGALSDFINKPFCTSADPYLTLCPYDCDTFNDNEYNCYQCDEDVCSIDNGGSEPIETNCKTNWILDENGNPRLWYELVRLTLDLGQGSNNQIIVGFSQSDLEINTPDKDGFLFRGWYVDNEHQTIFDSNIMPSINTTLYPKWLPAFTLSLDTDGGSSINDIVFAEGDDLTNSIPTPTRAGFTFGGWYLNDEEESFDFSNMSIGDLTLKAKWILASTPVSSPVVVSPVQVSLSFDVMGGRDIAPISLLSGSELTLPTPSRPGYRFEGWYWNNQYSMSFVSSVMPYGNVTLYAKWTLEQQVTYVAETPSKVRAGNLEGNIRLESLKGIESLLIELEVEQVNLPNTLNRRVVSILETTNETLVAVYDIELYKTVTPLSGNSTRSQIRNDDILGVIEVYVPVPQGYQSKQLSMIFIDDDGSVEFLPSKRVMVDGVAYLVFETDHFSYFAIVTSDGDFELEEVTPPTSDSSNQAWWLAALGFVLVISNKRKQVAKN